MKEIKLLVKTVDVALNAVKMLEFIKKAAIVSAVAVCGVCAVKMFK